MTQQKLGAMVGVSYRTIWAWGLKDAIQSRAVYIKNRQILEQAAALFASGTMTNEDKIIFMDEMTRLYLESKKEQKKMVEKMNRFAFLLARKEG